jgi:L-asparaginase II
VTRGDTVESVHSVHAVAVQHGSLVAAAGNPALVTFIRSAAKPLQALPLVRARDDLTSREIAIAAASHLAEPEQLSAVRALLEAAGAGEDDLECGAAGVPPSRLKHNCSGKHAGMLALCRARSWPRRGYRLGRHPAQAAILAQISAATEVAPDRIATGTDGCGVVAFALPLERMAAAFARLPELEGGARVVGAMRAHPELIRGEGAPDTRLLQADGGWFAKGGAEGVLCAGTTDRLGLALKVEDGNERALEPALGALLEALGQSVSGFGSTPVLNSRGETVGRVAASRL